MTKSLEQLENMIIQGRMIEFIRELICERWIKVKVVIPQGGMLNETIFLVAINGILGKWIDHSLQMMWQYTLQEGSIK